MAFLIPISRMFGGARAFMGGTGRRVANSVTRFLRTAGKRAMLRINSFMEWLSQPHIMAVVVAFGLSFSAVMVFFMGLGFAPSGVLAGSATAAFQSAAYGAFTPAGGLFALLTGMGMTGTFIPYSLLAALIVASITAGCVWYFGVGRSEGKCHLH